VCDTDEMMAIEVGNLGKKAIVRTLEPYDFHRLQISSGSLVVSWCSPCMRTPWKMMDRLRDCVAEKGMPEPGG
jgi:hypothetical protein